MQNASHRDEQTAVRVGAGEQTLFLRTPRELSNNPALLISLTNERTRKKPAFIHDIAANVFLAAGCRVARRGAAGCRVARRAAAGCGDACVASHPSPAPTRVRRNILLSLSLTLSTPGGGLRAMRPTHISIPHARVDAKWTSTVFSLAGRGWNRG